MKRCWRTTPSAHRTAHMLHHCTWYPNRTASCRTCSGLPEIHYKTQSTVLPRHGTFLQYLLRTDTTLWSSPAGPTGSQNAFPPSKLDTMTKAYVERGPSGRELRTSSQRVGHGSWQLPLDFLSMYQKCPLHGLRKSQLQNHCQRLIDPHGLAWTTLRTDAYTLILTSWWTSRDLFDFSTKKHLGMKCSAVLRGDRGRGDGLRDQLQTGLWIRSWTTLTSGCRTVCYTDGLS